MSVADVPVRTEIETLADLVERLGDIPLDRIRLKPAPGTATEDDVIDINETKQGLCELVEGVLVEKPVGLYESCVTMLLVQFLGAYLHERNLGFLAGPDGMIRFAPGLIREPDISVLLWSQYAEHRIPRDAVGSVIPGLAVEVLSRSNTKEVLSRSNTKKEIERKLGEYFTAGVQLVWIVDPVKRTVRVHTSERESTLLGEDDVLDGGDVLPGFELSIREWFSRAG